MIEPTPVPHETVILWHGDDYEPLAELRRAVEEAASAAVFANPARFGDDNALRAATDAYDAFADEALARATKVEMRGLGRKAWRGLLAEHPARKITEKAEDGTEHEVTHPEDIIGWNSETMPDPLVRASLSPGQFESDEKRDAWLDGLTDPEFSVLYSAAVKFNTVGGPDPKARVSSLLDPISSETSTSLER
jgi:hypothetical protein